MQPQRVATNRRAIPRPRDPNVRCHGIVYGFNILDPATMQVRADYVGQTVQRLSARERQHRGDDWGTDASEQPWSDLIVGKPFVIEEGSWTAAELDDREQFHIHRLRPRYNYSHNLANPDRVPIPVARRQREERDRARGVASPVWDRAARPARRPVLAPQRRQWSWDWLVSRPVGYLALWLTLAVGGCWAAVHWAALAVADGAKVGAIGASVLFVFALGSKPRRRRPPRPRRRRRR